MSRDEYSAKTNSYGVSGMTQEEVEALLSFNTADITIYEIKICPVCGKPYVSNTICNHCGFEAEDFNSEAELEEYRKGYEETIKEDANYIWAVSNED